MSEQKCSDSDLGSTKRHDPERTFKEESQVIVLNGAQGDCNERCTQQAGWLNR